MFYIFIMAITEKTRLARVVRWQGMKAAWESKLDKAENQNDTDVAKKMIAEAEGTLSRLESKGRARSEDVTYEKPIMDKVTKKVKGDRVKKNIETSNKAEEGTNIGL